jgi:hypothetical protein
MRAVPRFSILCPLEEFRRNVEQYAAVIRPSFPSQTRLRLLEHTPVRPIQRGFWRHHALTPTEWVLLGPGNMSPMGELRERDGAVCYFGLD